MNEINTKLKPPLGLTPRHLWLYDRVQDCIAALSRLEREENYNEYRIRAHEFAQELLYCTTEWESYYKDE